MSRCAERTTGPQQLQCQFYEGHPGGHLWIACDVDDRHAEGVSEQ